VLRTGVKKQRRNYTRINNRLSDEQKDLLVDAVQLQPILWDLGCGNYLNTKRKPYVWQQIALNLKLGLTGWLSFNIYFLIKT
jgi:Alcohol dehydrogenase transcription factor Myb/SANT-like